MPNHTHEWADEDIGMNCGRYSYREGERVEEYFPDTQKDRIEFASSVMDVSPQDYALFLNASEKEYICLPDDEYEVIEAAGVKALFTNERLTADNIPKGLYCYHLRESDNGDRFASIENIVTVNHGGSVITKEKIELGEKGYIPLNKDTEPNFLGETMRLEDFWITIKEQSEDMGMEMTQL